MWRSLVVYSAFLIVSFVLVNQASATDIYYKGTYNSGVCATSGGSPRYSVDAGSLCGIVGDACRTNGAPHSVHHVSGTGAVQCANKNGALINYITIGQLTCPAGKEFNISLEKCVNVCPAGQTWDEELGRCRITCLPPTTYNEEADACLGECPEGTWWDMETEQCEVLCDGGYTWDYANETCVPECVEPEENKIIVIGDTQVPFCNEEIDESKHCNDIAGYITGSDGVEHQVCNDDMNECEESGGTFGFINDEQVCLPEDFAEPLPTCAHNGVVTIVEEGFVCESPEKPDDPTKPDVPGSEEPEKECEGEDCPTDPEAPPGTCNGPDCKWVDKPSEVSGGGTCEARPTCKGDAIACASLYQLWSIRCEEESATLKNDGQCLVEPECEGASWQCAIELQNWREKCAKAEGTAAASENATFKSENGFSRIDKGSTDLASIASGVFNQTGSLGSCPPPETVEVLDRTFTFSYDTACDAAERVRPFVLLGAGLIAAAILFKAF